MHEKDLYPAVETFLNTQKNCLSEYVGTELSLKRGKNKRTCSNFRRNTTMQKWNERELYERQIKIVDAQIDRLVYDLYGLTEVKVKVVGTPQKQY